MIPVKETSASLSIPSSWMLSLSDLELPLDLFMLRKYCPHLCRPASFFSLFSLARLFWNQTWRADPEMHQFKLYIYFPGWVNLQDPPNGSKGFGFDKSIKT